MEWMEGIGWFALGLVSTLLVLEVVFSELAKSMLEKASRFPDALNKSSNGKSASNKAF